MTARSNSLLFTGTAEGGAAAAAAAGDAGDTERLETALVIGGCGFVGYHVVAHLLRDEAFGSVCVVDRSINKDNVHGSSKVSYLQGDVRDADAIKQTVEDVKPSVIFHLASPRANLPWYRHGEFTEVNIHGTQNTIRAATESDSVKALVYCSSHDVYAPPILNAMETHPLWPESDTSIEYCRTKAVGDRLVLEANGPRLRTVSLRLGHCYGERQAQGLDDMLDMCQGNKKLVQIGNDQNLFEVASVQNCAMAHLIAAKALLSTATDIQQQQAAPKRVDGEAFNISDGAPVPFWRHAKVIWGAALGKDPDALVKEITIIPAWVMAAAVMMAEWLLWAFTLNIVKPPVQLSRLALSCCTEDVTLCIDKARERLGYEPVLDHDAVVARGVQWELARRRKSSDTRE